MNWSKPILSAAIFSILGSSAFAEFRAAASLTDITPPKMPVIVNGGMTSRTVERVNRPIHARSFAFSDEKETVVMVIVDSCMVPRDLIDEAKAIASKESGIPSNRILVSATHAHSAPSCMGALGTDEDPDYVVFLKNQLVQAIQAPLKKLQPAKIAMGKVNAADYTALRRWVIRPDRVKEDAFGNPTVRANMHAATNPDDVTGPSGPEDPDLSFLSIQTPEGKPIGFIANFSMHYYGDADLSPDYFGIFSEIVKSQLSPENTEFVAAMSHGCSGDIWRHDYEKTADRSAPFPAIDQYSKELADLAIKELQTLAHQSPKDIGMDEKRFSLKYRTPNKQLLEWSQRVVTEMGDRLPQSQEEIYAREQILLHEKQQTEVVLQAIRLGDDIGIASLPTETYALTGLKIKEASPLKKTMVIELANGGDGYIPPPEQHLLGGYNTWAARTAGLEVNAEPIMAEQAIQLLEKVSGKHRLPRTSPKSAISEEILKRKPRAYYRLDEVSGPLAADSSPNQIPAVYEPQVLFYLPGPPELNEGEKVNRAAHFAGHRLETKIPQLGNDYAITLYFWNGMPNQGRGTTGWIFSRGRNHLLGDEGDHLGIGGTRFHEGKLVFFHGEDETQSLAGKTVLERWKWYRLDFQRKGDRIQVKLDGNLEIDASVPANFPTDLNSIFFGGRCDRVDNFEGRLDEIAIFTEIE